MLNELNLNELGAMMAAEREREREREATINNQLMNGRYKRIGRKYIRPLIHHLLLIINSLIIYVLNCI